MSNRKNLAKQRVSFKKRYRNITASITVFLALVSGLMYYAYGISADIQKKQAQIDAAGTLSDTFYDMLITIQTLRITNLEQDLIQNIDSKSDGSRHIIEEQDFNSKEYILLQIEKQKSLGSFYSTAQSLIDVLEKGGTYNIVESFDRVKPLESAIARTSLSKIQNIWKEYQVLLRRTVNYSIEQGQDIQFANDLARFAVEHQEALYSGIDEIIVSLNEDITEKSVILKEVQIIGIGLSLLYFLFFVGFFVRRLEKSDNEAATARRENEEILQTINSGLFLLDKDLNIGTQYSKELEHLWGKRDFGGQNMLSILSDMVGNPKDLETASSFIRQLYNPRVKEKLIGSFD